MVLPIYVYGHDALRQETEPVEENTDDLQSLIDDMIETMRNAAGIGLAAPQVGRTERLFVVDLTPMADEMAEAEEPLPPQPMVLINPEIVEESTETVDLEEGCLSIPEVREAVTRPERIRMRYLDRTFEEQEIEAGHMLARVLQHERDHLDGILFTDYLSSFRKRLLQRPLREMVNGEVEADYPLVTQDDEQVPAR
ncbi:MAG: peptide deformylase [Bacteroidetes bacterium SW_8_64_56]|nr:MAG: peptide deformylase [Bacteroidetes bacterium SW_7_64_58]PSR04266.1 MAG: peptide deformylase [Bacteroidetes bacterium SW_8_64_56]